MDVSHANKINFNFYVSVQFANYVNINKDDQGFISVPTVQLDKMIFYPAFLRSFSGAARVQIAVSTILAALSAYFF